MIEPVFELQRFRRRLACVDSCLIVYLCGGQQKIDGKLKISNTSKKILFLLFVWLEGLAFARECCFATKQNKSKTFVDVYTILNNMVLLYCFQFVYLLKLFFYVCQYCLGCCIWYLRIRLVGRKKGNDLRPFFCKKGIQLLKELQLFSSFNTA